MVVEVGDAGRGGVVLSVGVVGVVMMKVAWCRHDSDNWLRWSVCGGGNKNRVRKRKAVVASQSLF